MQQLGIRHITTRPVAPWTNGRAERMVRTVKACLKRTMASRGNPDWEQLLPWLQAAINGTISRSTGFAPHEVLFGEPPSPLLPRNDLPPVPPDLASQPLDQYVKPLRKRLASIHAAAREAQRSA